MEPEEFNEGYDEDTTKQYEYHVKSSEGYYYNYINDYGNFSRIISSSMVGKEFFSKLLGARVRVMLSSNSDEFYSYFYCEHCAYKTICNKLPDDILLSDGCFCSLTGLDGKQFFIVIEQVYPVEELENFHKSLFEVNQSYFEYDNEKIDLMKFLINLEYLKYNNEDEK